MRTFLVFATISAAAAAHSLPNLLKNPYFSSGLDQWTTTGMTAAAPTFLTSDFHQGNAGYFGQGTLSQSIDVEYPGQLYFLNGELGWKLGESAFKVYMNDTLLFDGQTPVAPGARFASEARRGADGYQYRQFGYVWTATTSTATFKFVGAGVDVSSFGADDLFVNASTPEPASFVAIALGGIPLLRRRKRS